MLSHLRYIKTTRIKGFIDHYFSSVLRG